MLYAYVLPVYKHNCLYSLVLFPQPNLALPGGPILLWLASYRRHHLNGFSAKMLYLYSVEDLERTPHYCW